MESNWQRRFGDIKSGNLHTLDTGYRAKCSFSVGDENNKEIISAHKFILSLASPVFDKMFYGRMAEKSNLIVIHDVPPDNFKTMLRYIYSEHLRISSLKTAFELYYLAEKYMLSVIQKQCIDYLWSKVGVNNALECYEFAEMFQLNDLKVKSMQVIINKTSQILNLTSFTDISMSTLMAILDQNRLNINSELELFKALQRFANERVLFGDKYDQDVKLEFSKSSKDPFQDFICRISDNNTISKPKTVKNNKKLFEEREFRKAVQKIRFLTMTPQEFAGPATSKLLKKDEVLAFFIILCNPLFNQIAVPDGFSDSRVIRREY